MDIGRVNSFLKDLINDKKKIVSCLDDAHKRELLKKAIKKGLCIYPLEVAFKSENNSVSILIRKFILENLFKPIFNNNIILENTFNVGHESVKLNLSSLPFELVISQTNEDLFSFIAERSRDNFDEINYKTIFGFYYEIESDTEKGFYALLHDHYTPFIIENDNVILIEKTETAKYCISQVVEKNATVFSLRSIFISGHPDDITPGVIKSLKKELDLQETEDQIQELFTNNNILVRNQNRELFDTRFLMPLILKDENDDLISINNISFPFFFKQNTDKQKKFLFDIISNVVKFLKIEIDKCVFAFNENELSDIYSEAEKDLKTSCNMAKWGSLSKKYRYYKINPKYNHIFDHICTCNDLDFGSKLLCIAEGIKLDDIKAKQKLDDFQKDFENSIEMFFKNNLTSFIAEL